MQFNNFVAELICLGSDTIKQVVTLRNILFYRCLGLIIRLVEIGLVWISFFIVSFSIG